MNKKKKLNLDKRNDLYRVEYLLPDSCIKYTYKHMYMDEIFF